MKLRLTQSWAKPSLAVLSDAGDEQPIEDVRERMMAMFREGKLHRARFSATVWTDGKNKNHYRFPPEELAAFAESFEGMPYLKDHKPTMDSVGGTILESKLIDLPGGGKAIRQRIEAVKPWAIEAMLDGTARRFSVGWDASEYLCTVCNADILGDDCKHGPYRLGKKDKETGEPVELLWKGIEGVETSAVTHPAAPGTTTEEVMAALATMSEQRKSALGNPAGAGALEDPMLEKILSLLGLPAGTKEPEAIAAVERIVKAPPTVATKAVLGALGVPEAANENEVVARVAILTANVPRDEHEKVVSELSAMKVDVAIEKGFEEGKLTAATEAWARTWAKNEPVAFLAWLEKAPRQTPIGTPAPAAVTSTTKPASDRITDEELDHAALLGYHTPQEWAEAKERVAKYDARFARQ